jgi:hypothetical protein
LHRPVLGGQDHTIPDQFQGFVPIGLPGGDVLGIITPAWLEFLAAELVFPVGCAGAE